MYRLFKESFQTVRKIMILSSKTKLNILLTSKHLNSKSFNRQFFRDDASNEIVYEGKIAGYLMPSIRLTKIIRADDGKFLIISLKSNHFGKNLQFM